MSNHRCPYCEADVSGLHTTISASHAKRVLQGAPLNATCICVCIECGEPIGLQHGVFRKPTFEEHAQMIHDGEFKKMRAIWLAFDEQRKRGMEPPAKAMWRKYVTVMKMTFPNKKIEENVMGIFLSGVAMSLNYFNEAMQQDDHIFLGRMELLEGELRSMNREAEEDETFEQIGEVLQRIIDEVAGNRARKPKG